jgi:hypothetical protein
MEKVFQADEYLRITIKILSIFLDTSTKKKKSMHWEGNGRKHQNALWVCYLYIVPETSWALCFTTHLIIFLPDDLADNFPGDTVPYENVSSIDLITKLI